MIRSVMAQETLYFPHDYDPLSDMKLEQFVKRHGAGGYGFFWRVVELLHQNSSHHLPFKQYVYEGIGDKLLMSPEQVEQLLEDCISKYDIFASDGILFWSERVLKNIEVRKQVVEQKSKAGKASAEARKRLKEIVDANPELLDEFQHPLTVVEHPSTKKERKKEII